MWVIVNCGIVVVNVQLHHNGPMVGQRLALIVLEAVVHLVGDERQTLATLLRVDIEHFVHHLAVVVTVRLTVGGNAALIHDGVRTHNGIQTAQDPLNVGVTHGETAVRLDSVDEMVLYVVTGVAAVRVAQHHYWASVVRGDDGISQLFQLHVARCIVGIGGLRIHVENIHIHLFSRSQRHQVITITLVDHAVGAVISESVVRIP